MDTNKIFIDMAQRAREFAEMCCLMQKMPGMPLTAEVKDALDEYAKRLGLLKADPDAWREECRKKQAAGVMYKFGGEVRDSWKFDGGNKEDYREVPQPLPHAAERALWKAQREAGTNEVWQWKYFDGAWIDIDLEPRWTEKEEYRVKPTKLTARICMVGKAYPMSYIGQDWEFTGTREEYRAECEKYGYVVISEIKFDKMINISTRA